MGRVALNGMTVLITGASSGIGKEVARILLFRYGCRVSGTGRSEEKLRAFAAEAGIPGKHAEAATQHMFLCGRWTTKTDISSIWTGTHGTEPLRRLSSILP